MVRKEMDATWLAVVAVEALVFLVWKMGSYEPDNAPCRVVAIIQTSWPLPSANNHNHYHG
jgi:hypothetical protein